MILILIMFTLGPHYLWGWIGGIPPSSTTSRKTLRRSEMGGRLVSSGDRVVRGPTSRRPHNSADPRTKRGLTPLSPATSRLMRPVTPIRRRCPFLPPCHTRLCPSALTNCWSSLITAPPTASATAPRQQASKRPRGFRLSCRSSPDTVSLVRWLPEHARARFITASFSRDLDAARSAAPSDSRRHHASGPQKPPPAA